MLALHSSQAEAMGASFVSVLEGSASREQGKCSFLIGKRILTDIGTLLQINSVGRARIKVEFPHSTAAGFLTKALHFGRT